MGNTCQRSADREQSLKEKDQGTESQPGFVEIQVCQNQGHINDRTKESRVRKKKRSTDHGHLDRAKPKRSHYSTIVILIVLTSKITTSCSFRSLSKVFTAFSLYLNMELSAPSFSTTKLWVEKIGYVRLTSEKEIADDWILILDESIGIGQERVLVILGIRRSKIDFTRTLRLQDMEPILVKSRERWAGSDITKELDKIKNTLGTILYAVTDGGSSLKAGLREAGIERVYDVTHASAIFLDKIYRHDAGFKGFTHCSGQMRYKLICSRHAHLIPPNQRSKSRFLNIDILCSWATKALAAYESDKISHEEKLQLKWLKDMEQFILEMDLIISKVRQISIILKNEGLSKKTKKKCLACLKKCNKGKALQFKRLMVDYLEENSNQITKYKEKILCCSDVIESTFGKYKNELSKNPMCGITDLVLIIPAFTVNLSKEWVSAAVDSCTVKDLQKWKNENLCPSLLTKRKRLYNQN